MTGFLTRGRMAHYADALVLAAQTGGVPELAPVRRYMSRGGVSVDVEQEVSDAVGVFARAGSANGDIEPYEFTDIDETLSGGVQLNGQAWGRADDRVGIAAVVNEISAEHQAFLAAGGLGILVGDGQLPNPGLEHILEAYYSLAVWHCQVTLDYQFVVNPGYNLDRGPVSVVAVRLHREE